MAYKDKAKLKAYKKLYYSKNRERIRAYHRNYYQANRIDLLNKTRNISKTVVRDANLKYHYGINQEWYEQKLKAQDGKCAICQGNQISSHKYYFIDHCHTTLNVRGLLCMPCNVKLASLENKDWFDKAVKYLAKYQ